MADADGGAQFADGHRFHIGRDGCSRPGLIDLPAFFLAVFVAAIADNYSRRMVMIVGRSLMMAAAMMLTILMAFGITDPWMILAFSFLDGCGIALSDPAWRASLGDMLERRHLPAAVTLLNSVRSVGPALGGLIVAAFGQSHSRSPRLALSPLSPLYGATNGRFKHRRFRAKRS